MSPSPLCTFVGGPLHGQRRGVPPRVRRVTASASTEFPNETARAVFYQRARYHHAARAGVDFFLLEGLSPAATETAFKSLLAGSAA